MSSGGGGAGAAPPEGKKPYVGKINATVTFLTEKAKGYFEVLFPSRKGPLLGTLKGDPGITYTVGSSAAPSYNGGNADLLNELATEKDEILIGFTDEDGKRLGHMFIRVSERGLVLEDIRVEHEQYKGLGTRFMAALDDIGGDASTLIELTSVPSAVTFYLGLEKTPYKFANNGNKAAYNAATGTLGPRERRAAAATLFDKRGFGLVNMIRNRGKSRRKSRRRRKN